MFSEILDRRLYFSSAGSQEGSSMSYLLEVDFRLPAVSNSMTMTPRVVLSATGTFSPIGESTIPGTHRFVTRACYTLRRRLLFLLYRVFAHWHFFFSYSKYKVPQSPAQFHKSGVSRRLSESRLRPTVCLTSDKNDLLTGFNYCDLALESRF